MKILKKPTPIECSCCGTTFEYDEKDVFDEYYKDDNDIVHHTVLVECPICHMQFSLRDDMRPDIVMP